MDKSKLYVYLWNRPDLKDADIVELHKGLSSHEQSYLETVSSLKRKVDFITGRYLLRKAFARFNLTLPEKLKRSPRGKPEIPPPHTFSISHSGSWTTLAFGAHLDQLGVDVQVASPKMDLARIVRHYGSEQDQNQFFSLSKEDAEDFFYQRWTCLEAQVKAFDLDFSTVMNQSPHPADCICCFLKVEDCYISVFWKASNNRNIEWKKVSWNISDGFTIHSF